MELKIILKNIFSWFITIVMAVIIALIIRNYVFNFAAVPTGSMEPTIKVGDKLLISRIAYKFSDVERGDIIVFNAPKDAEEMRPKSEQGMPLLKRVIALPGETVEIIDGIVYINGNILDESYVYNTDPASTEKIVIPEDCYFVLGDNRMNSYDARFWLQKYITKDDIIGKAVYLFSKIG